MPVAFALLVALLFVFWVTRPSAPPMEAGGSGAPSQSARLETPAPTGNGARSAGVTGASLAGFEPVREMNVTVMPQSGTP